MHDVYNLCKLAFENKLSFFKVKMLKEMCKHFEIPSNSRDTKSSLVKKLSQMVEDCSFMKEKAFNKDNTCKAPLYEGPSLIANSTATG
ncbi:hypothetical protein pdam_00012019 [Pocillopora damicornis]|uniref:HeH/LEM domain-containing protein n=1 Tax=Pocillopora damicornis TaxID=46731 RepID=A0A3M6THN3_POCDA|nr:hypothetical protein pdam_00012019 [Pocillopora damicornis]